MPLTRERVRKPEMCDAMHARVCLLLFFFIFASLFYLPDFCGDWTRFHVCAFVQCACCECAGIYVCVCPVSVRRQQMWQIVRVHLHISTSLQSLALIHPLYSTWNHKRDESQRCKQERKEKKNDQMDMDILHAASTWAHRARRNGSNENNLMMAEDECRVQIKANYMVEYADASCASYCSRSSSSSSSKQRAMWARASALVPELSILQLVDASSGRHLTRIACSLRALRTTMVALVHLHTICNVL